MKIAFSTLACPHSTWKDIYSMAKDLGFDGIEVRGLGQDIFAVRAQPFTEKALPETINILHKLQLGVSCFSSACCMKYGQCREENKAEIISYIELAARLKTPYVRVLADRDVAPEGDVDDGLVAGQLRELAPIAAEHGVVLLVESNGVYADTARLCRLLQMVASDAVAALWDMHHPYRVAGESPEQTVQNLGAFIKYVHIKDSVQMDGKVAYRMMGEGDMPIDEMMNALMSINYDGYVSLEWVKRWSEDLEDAGIVIPHFAHYMDRYVDKAALRGDLHENKSRTGQYVWEEETLIDLTFPQLLDRVAEEFPDQPAFDYTTLDYTRTYREFRDDVDVFARALIALGVKKGDKVAIWATNVPAWFITFWATTKIGAVLVTVNTAYKIYETEYLLRQSDTHTLVMIDGYKDANYIEIIRKICPELVAHTPGEPLHAKGLPFLRHVISVETPVPGCLTWEQVLARAGETPAAALRQRMSMMNRHDVCNIQYTSGTTGFPKGVMLSHHNVINNGKNIGDRMNLSTADRFVIHVPMFHCFGLVLSMIACVTHGAMMVPIPAFSPGLALEAVDKVKATAINGVPTMFIAMIEHTDFAKTDFSHMRTGIMAGSPCPVKLMGDVLEKMNMREITIVFGQTESSPGCTMSCSDDSVEVKVNTVGQPLPGIECKIVDPVTGEDVPDGVDGEFVARGYNIMKGYYKMPVATANAIDCENWLHTGDLACRRPDGNYRITGRIKDMIIRGGENIYPKEIEDFLYTHEKVRDVQVIGVPDSQYGEVIMACIILKDGVTAEAEEMKEYVRSHMAKHKTPRYVRFVDAFPMNAAGKVLKYKMVEEAVELLGIKEACLF
ncbi:MAG: AMP-binding protein [Peptococcaceae bacterium]|nr:AMP-binding protein [Peptococcaceae bacterium]